MHVISKRPFNDAAKKYPNDRESLMYMYKVLNGTDFKTPEELRAVFPSLDNFKYNDRWWVLDVGGNNLRVLAFIQFVNGRIYIKHIVNHPEYDKLTAKYRKASKQKRR
ncbi:type II toxin-antitoxin system HigB family toxin [Porticoccus sp. GXU_MW_L64]